MTRHRYPKSSLVGDYARAGMGLAVTAGPLALAPASLWVTGGFGALALVFALFAVTTALRQLSAITIDDEGIGVEGPVAMRLEWRSLDRLSLRYFALRRDRAGWMQLVLRARWRRLALDSRIAGFETICAAAAAAAERRGLTLGEATLGNLAALGIAADGQKGGWFASRGATAPGGSRPAR